ncbi:hypothetical protein ACFL35_02600 [Candidatus Riflebacteria bacterium]
MKSVPPETTFENGELPPHCIFATQGKRKIMQTVLVNHCIMKAGISSERILELQGRYRQYQLEVESFAVWEVDAFQALLQSLSVKAICIFGLHWQWNLRSLCRDLLNMSIPVLLLKDLLLPGKNSLDEDRLLLEKELRTENGTNFEMVLTDTETILEKEKWEADRSWAYWPEELLTSTNVPEPEVEEFTYDFTLLNEKLDTFFQRKHSSPPDKIGSDTIHKYTHSIENYLSRPTPKTRENKAYKDFNSEMPPVMTVTEKFEFNPDFFKKKLDLFFTKKNLRQSCQILLSSVEENGEKSKKQTIEFKTDSENTLFKINVRPFVLFWKENLMLYLDHNKELPQLHFTGSSTIEDFVKNCILLEEDLFFPPNPIGINQTFLQKDRTLELSYLMTLKNPKNTDSFHPVKTLSPLFTKNSGIELCLNFLKKQDYSSLISWFLPEKFTLSQTQKLLEGLFERTFDKRNFRKSLVMGGTVVPTSDYIRGGRRRPPRIYILNKMS